MKFTCCVYVFLTRKCARQALGDVVEYLNEEEGQVAVSLNDIVYIHIYSLYCNRCLMLLILLESEGI